MKNTVYAIAILVLAIILTAAGYYGYTLHQGELGQKQEFALLQGVEFDNRDRAQRADGQPILLRRTEEQPYAILGVPAQRNVKQYVWLILDGREDDQPVKMVPPTSDITLSCAYLDELVLEIRLNAAVLRFLKAQCAHF